MFISYPFVFILCHFKSFHVHLVSFRFHLMPFQSVAIFYKLARTLALGHRPSKKKIKLYNLPRCFAKITDFKKRKKTKKQFIKYPPKWALYRRTWLALCRPLSKGGVVSSLFHHVSWLPFKAKYSNFKKDWSQCSNHTLYDTWSWSSWLETVQADIFDRVLGVAQLTNITHNYGTEHGEIYQSLYCTDTVEPSQHFTTQIRHHLGEVLKYHPIPKSSTTPEFSLPVLYKTHWPFSWEPGR